MSQPEFDYLGPYQVEKILGRGGMGTVYKGVHARSGDKVAIKVIAAGVANQARFRRRFIGEVETLKRLKHPNIVTLIGHGEEQGLLFYSMEYVDGHTLHDHLRQHTKLPWEDVVEVGIQTASALKHAHDLGIIHRDLKPANLMLNQKGDLKLTDFGIAKLFGSTDMTAPGSVIGTADYMPPEQAEGKGVTGRSDVYSLGGVMYALLCGKTPFGGKSVPEVLYAVRYNPAPDLQERVPDVPHELCELVHQMLEKDPQKRPPTALVVANRLKSLQQGMKKRKTNLELESAQPGGTPKSGGKEKIGTQLTSLDLSDVDDEELRLTNEELDEIASPGSSQPAGDSFLSKRADHREHLETPGEDSVDTHEQRTMLAPNSRKDSFDAADPTSMANNMRDPEASKFSLAGTDTGEPNEELVTSGGPSHFTPIEDSTSRPFELGADTGANPSGADWIQYASIAGIVTLLLGSIGAGWWMLQPRSATEIHAAIMSAADSGDDSQLLAVKGDIEEFLSRFEADERSGEVQSLANELELTRWTRVLQRKASREGGRNELTAIEQAFLDCMRARSEDANLAQQRIAAFQKVFGPLENLSRADQRLLDLAEFAATKTGVGPIEIPVATEQLQELILAAEQALEGDRLEDYYRDLILLYGEKPWAAEQIKRIEAKLKAES